MPQEKQKKKEPNKDKPMVFVYGTLKKDHPNHGYLRHSEFVRRMYLTKDFYMVSLGGFPAIVSSHDIEKPPKALGKPYHIYGELYRVNAATLESLDCLEGHPDFYSRKQLDVHDMEENAWVYVLPKSYVVDDTLKARAGLSSALISEGVWLPTDEEATWMRGLTDEGATINVK